MAISERLNDSYIKTISRGDNMFRLFGVADDILVPGAPYRFDGTAFGISVGSASEYDLYNLLWELPNPVAFLTPPAFFERLAPGSPVVGKTPPVSGLPSFITVANARPLNAVALLTGFTVVMPVVDIWFSLSPRTPAVSAPRAPVVKESFFAVLGAVEAPLGFIYTFGRKTLFANLVNHGALPVTVRVAGRSLGSDGVTVMETTLTTAVVAAGTSFAFNRDVSDSYDALCLFATGPIAAPGVFFRLEARD
jgi:hypothetical protein